MTTAPTPPKPADEPEDPATKEDEPAWWERPRALVVAGLVTFGALIAWGTWSVAKWDERKIAEAGAFGDSFAPIVGLVSAAALCAAVVSVFIQRRELGLQRAELHATRKEMEAQRKATEAQAAEVKRANELAEEANRLQLRAQYLSAIALLQDVERDTVLPKDEHTRTAMEERGRLALADDPYRRRSGTLHDDGRNMLRERRREVALMVRELQQLLEVNGGSDPKADLD